MADQSGSDNFSFGPVRSPNKLEKENRSPDKHDETGSRRGNKQSRVRFATGPAEAGESVSAANKVRSPGAIATPLPVARATSSPAATPAGGAGWPTPIGGGGLPTPFGAMAGRVTHPPTPYPAVSPAFPAMFSMQAPAWRHRTTNAAFKGRSPSSSRQSSPASSSGVPETSTSRQSSLLEASSPLPYLNVGSSPLLTPGGRSLGRGLDDSPAISSASTASRSIAAADLSGMRHAVSALASHEDTASSRATAGEHTTPTSGSRRTSVGARPEPDDNTASTTGVDESGGIGSSSPPQEPPQDPSPFGSPSALYTSPDSEANAAGTSTTAADAEPAQAADRVGQHDQPGCSPTTTPVQTVKASPSSLLQSQPEVLTPVYEPVLHDQMADNEKPCCSSAQATEAGSVRSLQSERSPLGQVTEASSQPADLASQHATASCSASLPEEAANARLASSLSGQATASGRSESAPVVAVTPCHDRALPAEPSASSALQHAPAEVSVTPETTGRVSVTPETTGREQTQTDNPQAAVRGPSEAPQTTGREPLRDWSNSPMARGPSATPQPPGRKPPRARSATPHAGVRHPAETPRAISREPSRGLSATPQATGRGPSATPKTGGAREYGSWWTPQLPQGLTPAWLKARTPSWVQTMRQPDMDDAPIKPRALDLVALTPFLKAAPAQEEQQAEQSLPPLPELPRRQQHSEQVPNGYWLLLLAFFHLFVLIGAVWGGCTSYRTLPMMQLYHQQVSHDWGNTAPYMWSGDLSSHPVAEAYRHVADSLFTRELQVLERSARERPPRIEVLPTLEEIQQPFEQARQQQHQEVDARFAHVRVMHLDHANAEAGSDINLLEAAEGLDMPVEHDADDVFQQVSEARPADDEQSIPASCPDCGTATDLAATPASLSTAASTDAQSQSAAAAAGYGMSADHDAAEGTADFGSDSTGDADGCSADSNPSTCSGSGASWNAEEPMTDRLEGKLQGNWARAMAQARATLKPISLLADSTSDSDLSPLQDTDIDGSSDDVLSPQQDAAMDGSAGMNGNEAGPEYQPFPVIETGPFSRAWNTVWQAARGVVLSAKQTADGLGLPQTIGNTARTEQGAESSEHASLSQDLAEASQDLLDSVENMLGSLQSPDAAPSDEIVAGSVQSPDAILSDENTPGSLHSPDAALAHDDSPQPSSQSETDRVEQTADAGIPVAQPASSWSTSQVDTLGLADDAQAEKDLEYISDQQTPPSAEAVDEVESSLQTVWPHATSPLFALLAVTIGLGVLLRLLLWRNEQTSQLAEEQDCTTPISSPSRRQLFATTDDGFSPTSGATAQHSPSVSVRLSYSPDHVESSDVGDFLAPLTSVQERMTRSAARRQSGPGLQAPAQTTPAIVQHAAAAVSTAHQSMARPTGKRRTVSLAVGQTIPEAQQEVSSAQGLRRSSRLHRP